MYNCSAYDDRVPIDSGINCHNFRHVIVFKMIILISKIEASNILDATAGLSHVHPSCKTEAEAGACKSDPVYMNIICDKSFCNGKVYGKGLLKDNHYCLE